MTYSKLLLYYYYYLTLLLLPITTILLYNNNNSYHSSGFLNRYPTTDRRECKGKSLRLSDPLTERLWDSRRASATQAGYIKKGALSPQKFAGTDE